MTLDPEHRTYFKRPKLPDAKKKQMCDEVRVRDRFCQPWGAVEGPSGREWCPKCGKKIGGEYDRTC